MADLDRDAFNRGVVDVLTLKPLRLFIGWQYDRLVSWHYTRRIFEPRCSAYEPACPSCKRWREHDDLFNERRG